MESRGNNYNNAMGNTSPNESNDSSNMAQFPNQRQPVQSMYSAGPEEYYSANSQDASPYQPRQTVVPINVGKAMNITNVTDLQSYSQGTVVRLPDFCEGQPLVVRLRRPSMLAMAKMGRIPNALLQSATELFQSGVVKNSKSENLLGDMYDVCKVICKAALIAPSWDEIEASGVELSDQQILAIFNYTQVGVDSLNSFRKE